MQWKENENGLTAKLKFTDQTELAEFVLKLAKISDEKQHHTDMEISYNELSLRLISHDAGKVTERDHAMAERIKNLAESN